MPTPIDVDDAIDAIHEHAFDIVDEDDPEHRRTIVHCFAGNIGCDWDVRDAINLARNNPDHCVWHDHWTGRCLHIFANDINRWRVFDTVHAPKE